MKGINFLGFLIILAFLIALFSVEPTSFSNPAQNVVIPRATQSSHSTTNQDSSVAHQHNQNTDSQEEISRYESQKNLSPYAGKIEIRSLRTSTSRDTHNEYIRLSVDRNLDVPINITGWTFKSLYTNNQMSIPQGTRLYRPNGQSIKEDIIMYGDEEIYISTDISPINESFLINKCSGYHEQFNDFNPNISLRCPTPAEDLVGIPLNKENEACREYIERMPRCKIQDEEVPIGFSGQCREYIYQKVSYPVCVDNHIGDIDFQQNEWRIFLGRKYSLWDTKYEDLQLLDNEGRIVDTYQN